MKLKFISAFLALTLLFSTNANASFFFSNITQEVFQLVSKLSDDIGIMADRILDMADKIGDMSDRIVHTEELMAQLTTDLANQQNSTTNATLPTVLITADNTMLLNPADVPSFTVNTLTDQIIVYISPTFNFTTNTTAIVLHDPQEISQQWNQLQLLAEENKIYIAIKTIDGNTISSLSNVLTFTTLY